MKEENIVRLNLREFKGCSSEVEAINDMWDVFYDTLHKEEGSDTTLVIELDVGMLGYLDSCSMNLFICMYKLLRKQEGILRLIHISDTTQKAFNLYKLDRLEGFEMV